MCCAELLANKLSLWTRLSKSFSCFWYSVRIIPPDGKPRSNLSRRLGYLQLVRATNREPPLRFILGFIGTRAHDARVVRKVSQPIDPRLVGDEASDGITESVERLDELEYLVNSFSNDLEIGPGYSLVSQTMAVLTETVNGVFHRSHDELSLCRVWGEWQATA